jgi:hypothetical protein
MTHLFHHRRKLWLLPIGLLGVALAITVAMLLWNALLPDLFHAPAINFWQAAGLMLLSRLLLGGFHCMGHHRHGHKNRFRERWEHLSPEEREETFKNWDKLHGVWHGKECCREPRPDKE